MSVERITLPTKGGYNSSPPRSQTNEDYSDAENHVLAPGGNALEARPGYQRTCAFKFSNTTGDPLHHRLIIADGGDCGHAPGSTLFAVMDGLDGHGVGAHVYQGGVPFPSDSENNPNPPHEWMSGQTLLCNCDEAFTSLDIDEVIVTTSSTLPVLRKDDDAANEPTYNLITLTEDAPVSELCYFDVEGGEARIIPQEDNAIQFWLYYDGRAGIVPPSLFSFLIATEAALGGTVNEAIIDQPLMPQRWHCITVPLGSRVGTFNLRSIGLKLNSAIPSDLFTGGLFKIRIESVYRGFCYFLTRVSAKDTFTFNMIASYLMFGNKFNGWFMYDGADVMPAGIPSPVFKPTLALQQEPGVAATLLEDGTDASDWDAAQTSFVAVSGQTLGAEGVVTSGGDTFTVPAPQSAFVAATNPTTNPVSPAGGAFLELEFTGQPLIGTAAYRDISGTLGSSMSFYVYFDFRPSGTVQGNPVAFRTDCLEIVFWSGAAATGTVVARTPLTPFNIANDSLGRPTTGNPALRYFDVDPALPFPSSYQRWLRVTRLGLTGGAFLSVSIEVANDLVADYIFDSSDQWRVRFDAILGATGSSNDTVRLSITQNTGANGTVIAAPVPGIIAYKTFGAPTTIAANKSLRFRANYVGGPSGLSSSFIKVDFWSGVNATGTNVLGDNNTWGQFQIGSDLISQFPVLPTGNTLIDIWMTLPPAGVGNFQSFSLSLTNTLADSLFNSGPFLINIREIAVINSVFGSDADGPERVTIRAAFTYRDPDNGRESNPSPFSDPIVLPVNGVLQFDLSGALAGNVPEGAENCSPDPRRVTDVGVYVNSSQWAVDQNGFPTYALVSYMGYPAGGRGNQIVTLGQGQNLNTVNATGALMRLTNGYPPACDEAAVDGIRIAMVRAAEYSVGTIELDRQSPVVQPVADGNNTPQFGPWMLYLNMRLLVPGAEGAPYTIIHTYEFAGEKRLLISNRFDPDSNAWDLTTVLVSSDDAGYLIYGQRNRGWYTTVHSDGPAPWAVAFKNNFDLAGGDQLTAIGRIGENLYVLGREKPAVFRQRTDVIDDFFSQGLPYIDPTFLSSNPGIMAPRTLIADATGRGHWLAQEGTIMIGEVTQGFVQNPLTSAVFQLITGQDAIIDTEGAKYSFAVYDNRRQRLILFFPEPAEG